MQQPAPPFTPPPGASAESAPAEQQRDAEHLRILVIGYYVLAGLSAIFALLPLLHVIMGVFFVVNPPPGAAGTEGPPVWFGWLFVGIGSMIILMGEAYALLMLLAGRSLSRRSNKLLIQVAAAVACLNMPLGTLIGVFTFVVLGRPSVMAQFVPPA